MTSLRKSFSEVSMPRPAPKCQTLFAHCSNSLSWVTPRSSWMASNSVRPGDLRLLLGSPPSRCLTTSVVRFIPPTLLTPATYRPSHLTRNLKFLYGSNRCALTVNWAIAAPSDLHLPSQLLDLDDHEFGRLQRGEHDADVHDAEVDVVLGGGRLVAQDGVRILRRLALERALAEQVVHEGAHVEAYRRPERLVVGLEDNPLRAPVRALLDEQREPADGNVLVLVGEHVGAAQRARPPDHAADDREGAEDVDPV